MRGTLFLLLIVSSTLGSGTARADDRPFCADRPGIGTSACTLAPGTAMLEVGIAQWDHADDAQSVDDSFTFADTLLRVGVTQSTEIHLGLTSYTTDRVQDRATGLVSHASAVGDGLLAVRQGLAGANGPVAIEAFVTVPVGAQSAGDWGAGLLLPVDAELPHGFELNLTPEIDAAVNASGNGRHLAYGGVIGVGHDLGETLSLSGELAAFEDNEAGGHSLDARLTGSLAWQVRPNLQLDIEADLGLSAGAPDHSLMIGLARRLR